MGISAVPGSGKTWTLSQLAVQLILNFELEEDQEILIVTFSNSAVDNFQNRINAALAQAGLVGGYGFKVRTIHGLSNDIIHERPELSGLPHDFSILDENLAADLRDDIADRFFRLYPDILDRWLITDLDELKKKEQVPFLLSNLAKNYISTAKDLSLTPDDIERLNNPSYPGYELLSVLLPLYRAYQDELVYRSSLDFSDLIRLATQSLKQDPTLLTYLRKRWPIILEDEAQDSSLQQEELLGLLAGENGNWVRVGDPNQSINQTYTTANPDLLKNFVSSPKVKSLDLPQSGRSTRQIIEFANAFNRWVQNDHPNPSVREALTDPLIQPISAGDPQPNPPSSGRDVEVNTQLFTSAEEQNFLINEVKQYLENHPDHTVAVLALMNKRVSHLADEFKKAGLPVESGLMNIPEPTRLAVGALANILECLVHPESFKVLAKVFTVLYKAGNFKDLSEEELLEAARVILSTQSTQAFLYPITDTQESMLDSLGSEKIKASLKEFRAIVQHWHQALILPVDQLILTIGQNLHFDAFETATLFRIASMTREQSALHPEWGFSSINTQLKDIAKNTRNFRNFQSNDTGFNPDAHPGKVVVATMHKSKGLEWDKVFLTSLNNYDFPSGDPNDTYISESWAVRDSINLEAELLEAFRAITQTGQPPKPWGEAGLEARDLLASERLRLVYVGITRARKSLTISMNTGDKNRQKPAVILSVLKHLSENREET
jgi:DNA helicase-2/ATP-dependent DNA helicase PcrA